MRALNINTKLINIPLNPITSSYDIAKLFTNFHSKIYSGLGARSQNKTPQHQKEEEILEWHVVRKKTTEWSMWEYYPFLVKILDRDNPEIL